MDRPAAPELRTDWLTGRRVILAEHRADRPNEFARRMESAVPEVAIADCPFCPGHEALTPPAVDTRDDGQAHWRVRVVPNMYPAMILPDARGMPEPHVNESSVTSLGAHEVIIESARHVEQTSRLSVPELADVLAIYRARLARWCDDGRFRFGLVFKNVGSQAGASLTHLHSQVIALPELPPSVAAEFDRASQHHSTRQSCAYCDLIASERAAAERMVLDQDGFLAFCPYASLQPCEVWLLPSRHEPWFEQTAGGEGAEQLAQLLHSLLARIESIVPFGSYNLLVRTAPWTAAATQAGHWRIEILPRVNPLAGLELATGIHINPISPTRAAAQLRFG
jgi:UDPglucose--hexose-1-phosphate uridylyltransferase